MLWSKEKINSVLPQREPFLFIDQVIKIEETEKILAVKFIKGSESYFQGHFPGKPVMPGVLIIEAMAQAGIILFAVCKPEIADSCPDYYLGKVKAAFLAPVFPENKLILEAGKVKITDNAGIIGASARIGEKIVARADFVLGVKRNG